MIAVYLGCFMEGETAAIIGGVLAQQGIMAMWQAALAATLGAFTADFGIFLFARRSGTNVWVTRQLARPAFARTLAGVNRNPHKLASIYRFIPGMRIIGPVVLAQSRITTLRFGVHAMITALIWAVAYVFFGVAIGEFLARVFGHLSGANLLFAAIVVAALAATATFVIRRRRRAAGSAHVKHD